MQSSFHDVIESHIKVLVSKLVTVPVAEIDESELLRNYGMNSIDMIDLVAALETKYGNQFDPTSLADVTCNSLASSVVSYLSEQ